MGGGAERPVWLEQGEREQFRGGGWQGLGKARVPLRGAE